GVVDALEMVDVDERQHERAVVAPRAIELGLGSVEEAAAVDDAGERIGRGQDLELLLERLSVGDVAYAGAEADVASLRVDRGLRDRRAPAHRAVLADDAELELLHRRRLARSGQRARDPLAILLVDDLQRMAALVHALLGVVAGHALDAGIDPEQLALAREPRFPAVRIVGDDAEFLLAVAR